MTVFALTVNLTAGNHLFIYCDGMVLCPPLPAGCCQTVFPSLIVSVTRIVSIVAGGTASGLA